MQGEGLYLARVSARDLEALKLEHQTSFADPKTEATNPYALDARGRPTVSASMTATLTEGELVAVNRFGGIHRLDPAHVETDRLAELWTAGADEKFGALGDITEVRGDLLEVRADAATRWRETRDDAADSRVEAADLTARPFEEAAIDAGDAAMSGVSDVVDTAKDAASGAAKGALVVLDFAGAQIGKLVDFVASMFDGGGSPPPSPKNQVETFRAQRRALAAMHNIRDDIKNDRPLQAESIKALTPATLEGIRTGGDEYLRAQVERMDTERERDRGRGMER